MNSICITAKAYEAIAGHVLNSAVYDERLRGYRIALDSETIDRLRARREPFESMSDVIVRIARSSAAIR